MIVDFKVCVSVAGATKLMCRLINIFRSPRIVAAFLLKSVFGERGTLSTKGRSSEKISELQIKKCKIVEN